jgi:hypothetical protein
MRKLIKQFGIIRETIKKKGDTFIKNEFWVYNKKRKKFYIKRYYTLVN